MLVIKSLVVIALMLVSSWVSATTLNDPTKPSAYVETITLFQADPSEKMRLTVIKLEGNKRVAVIDNRTYSQGQHIGKEQLKIILLDRVIFSSGKELHLFGHSVVKVSK